MRDEIVAVYQTQARGVTYVWASGRETWRSPDTGEWNLASVPDPQAVVTRYHLKHNPELAPDVAVED